MSRLLVAGGTGVLGRRTVPLLVAAGHDVVVNVRDDAAATRLRSVGAEPIGVDLFDASEVRRLVDERSVDTVVNLATSIPTGASAAGRRAWRMNDRLRTEAAQTLAEAVPAGGRYVGESITFPYEPSPTDWLDETTAQTFFWGNESVRAAEAAARSVSDRGGTGVTLRFAMFWAADSAHIETVAAAAHRGIWAVPGPPESYMSWIHVDDAAAAVVAALGAPAGVFNVAEADPLPRGRHGDALAHALGRSRLRAIPPLVQRLGGVGIASMARSQRISSTALRDATGWTAQRPIVDRWADLART